MQALKIVLIGYGKMGHVIEEIACARGHEIATRSTSSMIPASLRLMSLSSSQLLRWLMTTVAELSTAEYP